MVAMISSYLFDKPTHLNDLYNRKEDFTTQYWTLPYVAGTTLADKPAFVLSSKSTFSGAEEFTYNGRTSNAPRLSPKQPGAVPHNLRVHLLCL
jgi:hypothetical protein